MIGKWLDNDAGEWQLENIANANNERWIFGDFGVATEGPGCLLTLAFGGPDQASLAVVGTDGVLQRVYVRYDRLNNRAVHGLRAGDLVLDEGPAHPRIVEAIRSRARRILAERRLAALAGRQADHHVADNRSTPESVVA